MAGELYNETTAALIKAAQELMYNGTMTVYQQTPGQADSDGITRHTSTAILTDQPCHISYNTIDSNNQENNAGNLHQEIVLYCDPDLTIPEGSKITVTQNGVTCDYQLSGKPAVFMSHQEIDLVVFREYA